ncbi:MAG TPA: transporter [Mycobacteriales bacterium]|nr:transporter [Mycobacteriales bacterium]
MPRLLLTLATIALAASAYALMLKGWRGRQRRQGDLPPLPAAPAGSRPLVGPVTGLFVGTTAAEDWLDRIAVQHLSHRAAAALCLDEAGVRVERSGLPPLLLPWEAVDGADVETALGGKVVSTGMLVLTWRWGGRRLRSAFRPDHRADNEVLRAAITARLALEATA